MTSPMGLRAPSPGLALFTASAIAILTTGPSLTPSLGGTALLGGLHESHTAAVALTASAGAGISLTNGIVLVSFHGAYPVFTISSLNDSRVATTSAVDGIAEVHPNKTTAALASFNSFSTQWTARFSNTSGYAVLLLSATVAVAPVQTRWDELAAGSISPPVTLGSVNVTVGFSLNRSPLLNPAGIRVWVNATHWPWVNASDSLGLALGLRASPFTRIQFGATEYELVESTTGTGNRVAAFDWGRSASVMYGSGSPATSVTGSFRSLSTNASNSSVRLIFSGVASGYSSLSYDPYVQLNLSAFSSLRLPAWVLTATGLAAIGIGGTLTTILAVAAARRRRIPEDSE